MNWRKGTFYNFCKNRVVSEILHDPLHTYKLYSWLPTSFFFHRLEKKELDTLGDMLQELQREREKCKSLEIEVRPVPFVLHSCSNCSCLMSWRNASLHCTYFIYYCFVIIFAVLSRKPWKSWFQIIKPILLPPPKK